MKRIFMLIIAASLLTSCYTKKPFCDKVYENTDHSDLIQLENPSYKMKFTLGGGALLAGGTAAGGYVGNSMNKDYITTKYNTANTVIGAAIGLGITAGIMAIFKPHEKIVNDPNEWMNIANNSYAYAGKTKTDFYAIPRSIEKSFVPKSLFEAQYYSIAFPHSSYRATVVEKVMPRLSRNELVVLDSSYQEPENRNTIRKEYIMRANNTCDFIKSTKKYPGIIINESDVALRFLKDFSDIVCYKDQYSKEAETKSFIDSAIAHIDSYSDVKKFVNLYPYTSELDGALTKLEYTCSTENYCELYSIVNDTNKQILHDKMFADASSFSDFDYIAKTIPEYTEEAILASIFYIESYDYLITAKGYAILKKAQINSIINKNYLNYSFDELIACKSDFPSYPSTSKLGNRSVEKASTISQCKTAANTYPNAEAAADDKAYSYANGSIEKSEEFLDAFPAGDNSLSIVIALVILKADKYNELISQAETAIANDDYNRSENLLNEAKGVMPNDNYVDPLNVVIAKHNSHKRKYLAKLEAEIEQQQRYEDAQPWVVTEFDTFISTAAGNSKSTAGEVVLSKPSGRTMRMSVHYSHDVNQGMHTMIIGDRWFSHSQKYGWITGNDMKNNNSDAVYGINGAIKITAEIVANKYY